MDKINSVITQLQVINAEVDALNEDLLLLKDELANTIATDTAKISNLNAQITSLTKQLADCQGIVTPPPPPPPPPPPSTDLYFAGNMDTVTIVDNKLVGWDLLKQTLAPSIFFNTLGRATDTIQRIETKDNERVLYLQTIDDDPNMSSTSRAQMTLKFKSPLLLPVYHTSHRMFLHPDLAYLSQYSPGIGFFTIYEIWNDVISGMGGSSTGSCRWNLSFFKNSGVGSPLFWHIEAEKKQPGDSYMWRQDNKTIPIPFGKWFTLDWYQKPGEGSNGKLVVKITVDGITSTLFDINNTTIYPGYPNTQIKEWQSFKLYSSDTVLDWMRNNGKKIAAWYNDMKWYKS